MRLELGSFPVRTISFGPATRWDAGHLTVDRAAALAEVRRAPRVVTAGHESPNAAAHKGALTVSDHVARATAGLTPPERETFELTPCDPALPRVAYIWGVHSPQAMSGSLPAFCTAP